MRCGDCQFFSEGRCRRQPPMAVPHALVAPAFGTVPAEGLAVAVWPKVGAADWCGEFRAKPLPQPVCTTCKQPTVACTCEIPFPAPVNRGSPNRGKRR